MEPTGKTGKHKRLLRDGFAVSPWQTEASPVFTGPAVSTGITYDALIIGGGITGVTTAMLLQSAGKKCLLVDGHNIGFGTTGGTSAHINTFADTPYKDVESGFGKDGAKLFADAIKEGLAIIKGNVQRFGIDCDFEEKKGYVYAEEEQQVSELNELYEGCLNVGVDTLYTGDAPTPVPYIKALVVNGQAQFHPLKYLTALALRYIAEGGCVLEHTMVNTVKSDSDLHLVSAGGMVLKARNVVYATHIPPGITAFSFRCAPYRSYVLGVKLRNDSYPDALVYDMQEPYHYFRTHEIDGQKYLIAGGNDHKTGHEDPTKAFADLEAYVRKYYLVDSVKFKWSSQYYVPADGLPYIGLMPGKSAGIYCATGYNGNGMMLGSVAARILADLVLGIGNRYKELFDPGRLKPLAGLKEIVTEGADVVYQFFASRFSAGETSFLTDIGYDQGKVIELDGKKLAVYRDGEGRIHALNPVCTHAGCVVSWNGEEKSWDCPCHGARYSVDGVVLNGPADKGLQKIDF
jgi:glycine/D-amino acid oxidase-like deaminating enzyme/nitrite reductase/ring-hydroxylating ferredoxin subunit